MIQLSLTQKQLSLIKDSIDSFDTGELSATDYNQFKDLKAYIDYQVKQGEKNNA